MKLQEIIADIHALNKELERFENKYGLLSETFYELYLAGEEPEDEDWVADFALWAGLYEIKLERELKRRCLRIQRFGDSTTVNSRPAPRPCTSGK